LPLSSFKGKAVLVVNTASECGDTPQYLVGPDGALAAWFSTKTSPTAKDVTTAIEDVLP
jgi:glutathione peroxidase-family protein